MIAIQGVFESHLMVADLERSVRFYRDILRLQVASVFEERRAAMFWIGSPGKAMLGLWEVGCGPQKISLHVAFEVGVDAVLAAPQALIESGVAPLDFDGMPTGEPVVLGWMPAAAVYFRDPDGNLLEFLAMLQQEPRPEAGVVAWSSWLESHKLDCDPSIR